MAATAALGDLVRAGTGVMAAQPRRPTMVIVVEGLLRPVIRDQGLRRIAAILIFAFWKVLLTVALLIVTAMALGGLWLVLRPLP